MGAQPASPLLGMYQTNGTFPTPGPTAWASGPRTNTTAQYLAWGQDVATYATAFLTQCKTNLLIPFLELEPWEAGDDFNETPLFTDITSGMWDTWLLSIGSAIAASGKDCMLTFAHEMNVSGQYPWSQGDRGSGPGGGELTPAQWILGWKYVHDKINSTAGGHAIWMWACSAFTGGTTVSPAPWWPGASYVDMVGIDGYPSTQYGASLGTFAGQIQPTVSVIRGLGWTKDIFLAETNLRQMVDTGGQDIASYVAAFHAAGCSGILEFEDASWGLNQMSAAQWATYNGAINAAFGTSGGGDGGGDGGDPGDGTDGRVYTQNVYDAFDGGSFDTTKWTTPNGTTGLTQASGTLSLAARTTPPEVDSVSFFDLTSGLWAVKWSHTGTGTTDTVGDGSTGTMSYWGFKDTAGDRVEVQAWPPSNHWKPLAISGATVASAVGDANIFGAGWTDGDYIGFGNFNIDSDNKLHIYSSPDGVAWTEIGSFVITGAINMASVKFVFGAKQVTGSSTWVSVYDEASDFPRFVSGGGGGDGGGGTGYLQSVIDDFNDNSFNTHIWATPNGTTGLSETGSALHIQANAAYVAATSPTTFDLSKGIIGAQITPSGTVTGSSEVYIFANDTGGNSIQYASDPSVNFYGWDSHGATTHSNDLANDGVSSTWVAGDWIGIGNYDPSTKIVHAYKSHDGLTWTEIGKTTIAGTFGYATVGIGLMAGDYGGGTTYTVIFDNPSTFILGTAPPSGGTGYTQTIIDNFNDNSFDTGIWTTPNGTTGITETGQKLNIADGTTVPEIVSPQTFDLATGILGAKYTNAGTGSSGGSSYTQSVIDNFDDNSFNTTLWKNWGISGDVTESSAKLQVAATQNYTFVASTIGHDLTTGIFGVQFSHVGTALTQNFAFFGATDANTTGGNVWAIQAYMFDHIWRPYNSNGSTDAVDHTVSTWTDGDWLGWGNIGSDNKMHFYKSSDGTTWTELFSVLFDGTSLTKTSCGIAIGAARDVATTSTYKAQFDNASYFASSGGSGGTLLTVGARDSSGNGVKLVASVSSTPLTAAHVGSATTSTVTGNGSDILSGWTDGDWIGVGNYASNTLNLYKSSDGQSWTQIGSVVVGGTFHSNVAGLDISVGHSSGTSTFTISLDDASKFVSGSTGAHTVKVRISGAWVTATPKARISGAWVPAVPKARVSGAWVTAS